MTTFLFPGSMVVSSLFRFADNTYYANLSALGSNFKFQGNENQPRFYIRDVENDRTLVFNFILASVSKGEVTDWLFRCAEPSCRHLSARIYNA